MTTAHNTPDGEMSLPVIPLRGMVIYPNTVIHLDIGRSKSMASMNAAINGDKRLIAVAQRHTSFEDARIDDLYTVGTIAKVKQIVQMPDGVYRMLIEGETRAILMGVHEAGEYWVSDVSPMAETEPGEVAGETRVYMRLARKLLKNLMSARSESSPELFRAVEAERRPGRLADLIAANALNEMDDRQAVLECRDACLRLKYVVEYLAGEMDLIQLESRITKRVNDQIDKANRDYYLREQLRVIEDELGDKDDDVSRYQNQLDASCIAGDARARVEKEIVRLKRIGSSSPESAVAQNYIETMLELPWGKFDPSDIDLKRARAVLEADHYALEDVKKRILEYLAVRALKQDARGPILCLVGAPGVGKTSIARSVARALGRKFCNVSLGGVHDEAEIRGHRRTYVASMPGRVVSAISRVGRMNPVFLFDEIDKLASDRRGDPASAMLEVLDPEQNYAFRDHYIDAPFDLSHVLFITTANSTDGIPAPLRDRMEIIEVPSYTLEEKVQIAKKHLWKKQLSENGLTGKSLRITDAAIRALIDGYTREAGVRALEKTLGAICRKAAVEALEREGAPVRATVKPESLADYLGAPRFIRAPLDKAPEVGVVNGLAWTNSGGEVMPVEVAVLPGDGKLELTGSLGDVMRESANVAWSYVRSHMDSWGVTEEYRRKHDIHVHVPEGATPKDGPSAGIALACAMMSAVTGLRARQDVCMTGEISLRGKALPIGGVKEKLLAAYRAGMNTVLLPRENAKDLELLPDDVRSELNIKIIADATEAIAVAISDKKLAPVKAVM